MNHDDSTEWICDSTFELDAIDGAKSTHAAASLPIITLEQGQLPALVDQAERLVLKYCPDIFQRAGAVVCVTRDALPDGAGTNVTMVRLVPVTKHHLSERLGRIAVWQRLRGKDQLPVPVDPPLKIAETYLARVGQWALPPLIGVINAPTLRLDGSVLDQPGYDPVTRLYFDPGAIMFEPLPEQLTRDDAKAALARLLVLLKGFAFVSQVDRAVALSGILTACIRRALPTAPMHAFSAPTAGSGKSMLVDVCSLIAQGHQAPVFSQGRDDAETEKRLHGALLAGDALISLDNCTQPLDGDLLCQIHTQPTVRVRPLGGSQLRDVPTTIAMFATGNALVIQGDMTRRALLCRLDPQCERPELRQFDTNPLQCVRRQRAAYVRDALIVLRSFHVAGRPRQRPPLGSFDVWSDWIRGALLWLDQADPVDSMTFTRENDPKLEALRDVMHAWRAVFGSDKVTVAEVIRRATQHFQNPYGDRSEASETLREALLVVAGKNGAINSVSLGKWLGSQQNRRTNDMRFCKHAGADKTARWSLVELETVF